MLSAVSRVNDNSSFQKKFCLGTSVHREKVLNVMHIFVAEKYNPVINKILSNMTILTLE